MNNKLYETAVIPCRTSSKYECGSLDGTAFVPNQTYTLQDKFFILSRSEIYGTWDDANCKDGEQLEYYAGLLNVERIKYDNNGAARTAWLRSPTVSYASHARVVSTDGSINGYGVSGSYGVAPACISNEQDAAEFARKIRNKLLDKTDKQMSLDRLGLDTASVTKFIASLTKIFNGGWVQYRQALRDLPEQEGFPFNITFPKPPES